MTQEVSFDPIKNKWIQQTDTTETNPEDASVKTEQNPFAEDVDKSDVTVTNPISIHQAAETKSSASKSSFSVSDELAGESDKVGDYFVSSGKTVNKNSADDIRLYLRSKIPDFVSKGDYDEDVLVDKIREASKRMAEADSVEEKRQIAIAFYKETGVLFDLPKMKNIIKEYIAEHPDMDEKVLAHLCAQYEELRQVKYDCLMHFAEDEKAREIATLEYKEEELFSIEVMQKYIAEHMPKDITSEEAERKLRFIAKYFPELRDITISNYMDKYKMSDAFREKINKLAAINAKKIKERTDKFIAYFFETAKGKAIKAYTRRIMGELQAQKAECDELRSEAEEKTAEAKKAEQLSVEAQQKAKKAEEEAKQIAANCGFKDLSPEALEKLLKHESTNGYIKYQDAQAQKKKAYWAEYDAKSSKRLADKFLEIAEKTLAFTKELAMIRIMTAMTIAQR